MLTFKTDNSKKHSLNVLLNEVKDIFYFILD